MYLNRLSSDAYADAWLRRQMHWHYSHLSWSLRPSLPLSVTKSKLHERRACKLWGQIVLRLPSNRLRSSSEASGCNRVTADWPRGYGLEATVAKPRAEECMHHDWLQHFFISKSLLAARCLNLVFAEPSAFWITMNHRTALQLLDHKTKKGKWQPPPHNNSTAKPRGIIRSETGRKRAQIVH